MHFARGENVKSFSCSMFTPHNNPFRTFVHRRFTDQSTTTVLHPEALERETTHFRGSDGVHRYDLGSYTWERVLRLIDGECLAKHSSQGGISTPVANWSAHARGTTFSRRWTR